MKKFLNILFLSLSMSVSVFANTDSIATVLDAYQNVSSLIINGKDTKKGNDAIIINNTAYVPIRLISEALGNKVYWEPNSKNIYISSNDNIVNISWDSAKSIAINAVGGGFVQMLIEDFYDKGEVPTYRVKILHGEDKYDVIIDARNGIIKEILHT